jgi:hypothetical protein
MCHSACSEENVCSQKAATAIVDSTAVHLAYAGMIVLRRGVFNACAQCWMLQESSSRDNLGNGTMGRLFTRLRRRMRTCRSRRRTATTIANR